MLSTARKVAGVAMRCRFAVANAHRQPVRQFRSSAPRLADGEASTKALEKFERVPVLPIVIAIAIIAYTKFVVHSENKIYFKLTSTNENHPPK